MRATTKVIALASGAVLSLAPAAGAHDGNGGRHATAYGAKLTKTVAATDPAYADLAGKAVLVDGARNNALLVHVRHLKPSTAYTFELSTAPCDQDSATVAAFGVTDATSNAAGHLSGKATSTAFDAADGTSYSVVVKEGTIAIACGRLDPLRKHGSFKHHKRHRHHARHGHRAAFHKAGDDRSGR